MERLAWARFAPCDDERLRCDFARDRDEAERLRPEDAAFERRPDDAAFELRPDDAAFELRAEPLWRFFSPVLRCPELPLGEELPPELDCLLRVRPLLLVVCGILLGNSPGLCG